MPTRTPEASEPASRYHSLFGQRDFTFLWWSQVAHWSGDAAYAIGILWIMQEMTGSTAMMGLVGALRVAPSALGLVTGVLVDRWRPRNVLVGATFARAVIVVSVPLLWGLQVLKPWHLLVIAVLQGCTGIFLMPSRNALMPAVVPGDRLIQANALMMFSAQVTQAVSYSAAGVAIGLLGTISLFYFNAGSMAVSALLLWMIETGRSGRASATARAHAEVAAGKAGQRQRRRATVSEMREGFDYILSNAVLIRILLLIMVMNFLITPLFVLLPVWTREVLLSGPQTYGFVQSAYQVGMIMGSLLIGYIASRTKRSGLIFSALVMQGVALLGLTAVRTTQAALLGLAAFGVLDAFTQVTLNSYLQASVPRSIRGRVFSCTEAIGQMISPAGQALGGALAEIIPLPVVFGGIGLGRLLGPLAYGLSPVFRKAFDQETSVLDGAGRATGQ